MDCLQALSARRSYHGPFAQKKVPREHLKRMMEAGLDAPSGCNMQTVSLIGIDDPQVLAPVAALLNKPGFASAPAAICVLSQDIVSYGDTSFCVQDYAAAIENILLAAVAMGYASCWVEGYVTGESGIAQRMAETLGVPDAYRVVAYLPIGVPEAAPATPKKKAFAERAWFNGFARGQ